MIGQDKLGHLVLNEQVFSSKGLDKYEARLSKEAGISPETLSKVVSSINRLEWALFALNSFTLIGSRRAHALDTPKRTHPHHGVDHQSISKTWSPYPRRGPQLEFHEECHFACVTSLAHAAREIEVAFVKPADTQPSALESFDMKQKLEQWSETLPSCMKIHEQAMPHVIALQ